MSDPLMCRFPWTRLLRLSNYAGSWRLPVSPVDELGSEQKRDGEATSASRCTERRSVFRRNWPKLDSQLLVLGPSLHSQSCVFGLGRRSSTQGPPMPAPAITVVAPLSRCSDLTVDEQSPFGHGAEGRRGYVVLAVGAVSGAGERDAVVIREEEPLAGPCSLETYGAAANALTAERSQCGSTH